MPKGDLTGEEAASLLQELCDHASTHLWLDLEIFNFGPDQELVPRPIDQIKDDLHRFPRFEKIICYQFPGLMSSPKMSIKPGGNKSVQLYLDYKKYIDQKVSLRK
jgi:hypothetical protein